MSEGGWEDLDADPGLLGKTRRVQRCLLTWSVGDGPGPLNTAFLKDPSSLCPQGLQVWFYKHPEAQACSLTQHIMGPLSTPPPPQVPPPSIFPLPLSPQLPTTVHRHVGPTPGIESWTLQSRPHSPHALTPHRTGSPQGTGSTYRVVSTTSFLSCCRYSRRRLGRSKSRAKLSCFSGLRLRVRREF